MRASAAGKIADPSSAASLENNWIVSAIGPRMGRLTAIGWTTICKRRGGFVEGGRRDEEILGTRRLERKEVAAKGSFLLDDSNESSKRVYANLKWNGIEESKIFATFFYAVFLT